MAYKRVTAEERTLIYCWRQEKAELEKAELLSSEPPFRLIPYHIGIDC